MSTPSPQVWPCVNFDDARAGIRFCTEVLGFTAAAVYAAEDDDAIIHHAELRWPEGGGFMCGSSGRADSAFAKMPTGAASLYVVTDDPQAVWERCAAAGTRVVKPMETEDYGSLGFTVADAEDNLWSFGTYAGSDTDAATTTS